jgi:hypothetical protein
MNRFREQFEMLCFFRDPLPSELYTKMVRLTLIIGAVLIILGCAARWSSQDSMSPRKKGARFGANSGGDEGD